MNPHDGRSELLDALTALFGVAVLAVAVLAAVLIGAVVGIEVVGAVLYWLGH